MFKKNIWINIYQKQFKDNLNPCLGLTKSEQIFKSRLKNQNLLLNSIIPTQTKDFGLSPYGKNLEILKFKLLFTYINHNLKKKLENFSEEYKSFKQFLNKNSNYHPKVFKTIITREIDQNNNHLYYNYILKCSDWDKIIRFDFYTEKDHFEILFVIKDIGYFLDLYVNKECIFENVDNVNSLYKDFYKDFYNLSLLCKKMNVKKEDLIKFIEHFSGFF